MNKTIEKKQALVMKDNTSKKYYAIRNKYLAETMAFLGYSYKKFGFGRDTEYSFEDTKEFAHALSELMKFRKKVGSKEKLQNIK